MKVELKEYTSWESYNKDVAQKVSKHLSMREAMSKALEKVREHKKEIHFVGFKLFDMKGQLRQQLHNQ